MKTQVTVDTGGRVLIPRELRNRLGVGPGDVLALAEAGDEITLKLVRETLPLEKRHGFWVYTGQLQRGATADVARTLVAADRDARMAAVLAGGHPESDKGE